VTDYAMAANFIEQYEPYLPVAKWDVDGYRIGYRSSTESKKQIPVVKHMVTTRERAFDNIEARLPDFENVIISQVGASHWEVLPDQAKVALLALAHDYGDLPDSVAYAVMQADGLEFISSAVEALAGDNHGVKKVRRLNEAKAIAEATGYENVVPRHAV
jgi:hypothetical protein